MPRCRHCDDPLSSDWPPSVASCRSYRIGRPGSVDGIARGSVIGRTESWFGETPGIIEEFGDS